MLRFWTKTERKCLKKETLADYTTWLPFEIWTKILSYLTLVDLCHVVLVSKFMNSMGSDPMLWTAVKISRQKVIRKHHKLGELFWKDFGGLFSINRFSSIEELDASFAFNNMCCCKFRYLLTYKSIKNINLSGLDLSTVDEDVLANSLSKFCKVNLSKTTIPHQHVSSFILASLKSTNLHTINLQSVLSISHVPPHVLSKIVQQPIKVDLSFTSLTPDQITSLLLEVIFSKRIQSLLLVGIDMDLIDCEIFSTALPHLRHVALGGDAIIPSDHLNQFFYRCLETSASLKEVDLNNLYLGEVEAEILAFVTGLFIKAVLSGTGLQSVQLAAILSHCNESSSLQELHLDRNNLSKIDANLLAEAVSYIRVVFLGYTSLSTIQLSAIFSRLSYVKSRLQELSVAGADLQAVEPELLAEGVSNLVSADLKETQLRVTQIKVILDNISTSSTIKVLNMENVPKINRFSDFEIMHVMLMNKKINIKVREYQRVKNFDKILLGVGF